MSESKKSFWELFFDFIGEHPVASVIILIVVLSGAVELVKAIR